MTKRKSSAPTYPDAEYVGPHLVIDRTDWAPGDHPDPHRREPGRTGYAESYFRCLRCGAERQRKRDFPDECDVAYGPIGAPTAGADVDAADRP